MIFSAGALLEIELDGTVGGDEYDQLDVAGSLDLGGTLQVSLIDGFAPGVGDTFDIFDFGVLGDSEFDSIELPELVGRKAWDASDLYITGEISVIGMLDGDTDADWDVDVSDYDAFIGAFGAAGDWRTDFNEDGRVDLADFALMRGNFDAGGGLAPQGSVTATTPEPASAVLLVLGLGAVLRRRKKCAT